MRKQREKNHRILREDKALKRDSAKVQRSSQTTTIDYRKKT